MHTSFIHVHDLKNIYRQQKLHFKSVVKASDALSRQNNVQNIEFGKCIKCLEHGNICLNKHLL